MKSKDYRAGYAQALRDAAHQTDLVEGNDETLTALVRARRSILALMPDAEREIGRHIENELKEVQAQLAELNATLIRYGLIPENRP